MSGKFLLIYICNFHVLSHFLLIYICKLHWNLLLVPNHCPMAGRFMSIVVIWICLLQTLFYIKINVRSDVSKIFQILHFYISNFFGLFPPLQFYQWLQLIKSLEEAVVCLFQLVFFRRAFGMFRGRGISICYSTLGRNDRSKQSRIVR